MKNYNFDTIYSLYLPFNSWYKKGIFIYFRKIEALDREIQGKINKHLPDDDRIFHWKKDPIQDITWKCFNVIRAIGTHTYNGVRKNFKQYVKPKTKKLLDKT